MDHGLLFTVNGLFAKGLYNKEKQPSAVQRRKRKQIHHSKAGAEQDSEID